MKLTRTLKITQDEFYDCIEENIVKEVFECTQRKIKPNDIKKGLKYSKNSDKASRIDTTIQNYIRGKCFETEAKTLTDRIEIKYFTEETSEGLSVTMHQYIASFEEKKHNKLSKAWSEAVYFGRMSDAIYDFQNKVLKNRPEK